MDYITHTYYLFKIQVHVQALLQKEGQVTPQEED